MNPRQVWETTGILVVFVAFVLILAATVENFATPINIRTILVSVSVVGMVACTMLFCLAGGDFDLSVGSTVALGGVIAALVVNKTGSVAYAVLIPVCVGAVVGLVNGFFIAKVGINALITTLATMQIVRGTAQLASDGSSIGVSNESFAALGQTFWLGLPTPVWLMIGCFVLFGVLLNKTLFGRNTLAVGGNSEAARLAGIAVAKTKIAVFTLQGMVAAFAGVVLASRVTSGQPTAGLGLELQVISACVLGGVSLTGGVGTITGVIVGVLIMGVLENAMGLLNIQAFWKLVISGSVLLLAVTLDRLKHRASLRRKVDRV
jgi:L-arabinose transport system permease protein